MAMKLTLTTLVTVALSSGSSAFVSPMSKALFESSTQPGLPAFFGDKEEEKMWGIDEKVDAKLNGNESSPLSKVNIPNPLAEIGDMFKNFDDVIDDFFNKRMGNGEIFYGKRKYKPSGSVESEYNGYGFSDFRKIEAAREFREERARKKAEMQERMAAEKKERY